MTHATSVVHDPRESSATRTTDENDRTVTWSVDMQTTRSRTLSHGTASMRLNAVDRLELRWDSRQLYQLASVINHGVHSQRSQPDRHRRQHLHCMTVKLWWLYVISRIAAQSSALISRPDLTRPDPTSHSSRRRDVIIIYNYKKNSAI